MKTLHAFRILSGLIMVVVTLAVTRPAYADKHVQEVVVIDDNLTGKYKFGLDSHMHRFGFKMIKDKSRGDSFAGFSSSEPAGFWGTSLDNV